MLRLNKNTTPIKLSEEVQSIERFNKAQIDLHELNKKENTSVVFRVNNHLPSGMILIDDLTDFVQGIQKIYRKAVNSHVPDAKKRVQKFIKNSTGLVISDVRAGSFEIELKQHRTQVINENSNMDFEQLTGNVHPHSLKEITNIVGLLHSQEVSKIILQYDLETFKASKEWIKSLAKSNNNFEYSEEDNKYSFNNRKITEIKNLLDTLNEDFEKDVEVNGILSVVNHQNSTIIVNERNSGKNYHIKVNDNEFRESELLTNRNVIAKVKLHEIMIDGEIISNDMYLNSIKNLTFL